MVKIPVTRKVRFHSPLTVVTVMRNNLVHVVCSIEVNFTPIMNNFSLYISDSYHFYMNVNDHTPECTGYYTRSCSTTNLAASSWCPYW